MFSYRFSPSAPVYLIACAIVCVGVFSANLARAEAPVAEALFLQGREALEVEDYETACEKFEESHRLDPAAGTVMNLATCEERMGRLASSWQHWQEALQLLPAGDERIAFARKRVEELESRLPHLTIRLNSAAPKNASIWRNGVRLEKAAFDVALPVDPGKQVIVVKAPGHASKSFRLQIGEGERREIEVMAGEPLPAGDENESQGSARRTWAFLAGGVGLAGVATGVATGLMLPSRRAAVEANCEERLCSPEGMKAASEGRTLLLANTIGWIVAGAGLGAGTYLLLTGQEDAPAGASGSPSQKTGRSQAGLGASVSPEGASISFAGSF